MFKLKMHREQILKDEKGKIQKNENNKKKKIHTHTHKTKTKKPQKNPNKQKSKRIPQRVAKSSY